jgi:hypothetical protein
VGSTCALPGAVREVAGREHVVSDAVARVICDHVHRTPIVEHPSRQHKGLAVSWIFHISFHSCHGAHCISRGSGEGIHSAGFALADRTYRSGLTARGPVEASFAVAYPLSSLRQTLPICFGRPGSLYTLGISPDQTT